MDGQREGQTEGKTEEQTDRRNRQTDRQTGIECGHALLSLALIRFNVTFRTPRSMIVTALQRYRQTQAQTEELIVLECD